MKLHGTVLYALALVSAAPVTSAALDLKEIGAALKATECYTDTATYDLLLASLSDPVAYTVALQSKAAPADTLAPCEYIITWSLPSPGGIARGFSAYFDKSHFRFRDKRLQEYHYAENPDPFAPLGFTARGVQRQVQFAEILPQFIGEQFELMASDSTYTTHITPDTIVSGSKAVVVEGVRRINGIDAMEYTYILDPTTYLPRNIELENNPGQIGEQSIAIKYSSAKPAAATEISYDALVAAEPEAFEKFRESTFSLTTLPGRPLPRIAAPTATGERYVHEREESFSAPTIFVFVETTVGSTPQVIGSVRKGVDSLPFQTDVVWAFLDHRPEDVTEIVENIRPGESLLINAGGAARDCGVGNTTPAFIFVSPDGHVADIQVGYNQELDSVVIQKATNSKYSN